MLHVYIKVSPNSDFVTSFAKLDDTIMTSFVMVICCKSYIVYLHSVKIPCFIQKLAILLCTLLSAVQTADGTVR